MVEALGIGGGGRVEGLGGGGKGERNGRQRDRIFEPQRSLSSSGDCVGFLVGRLWLRRGGCGHGITMLMVEAVGISGGGRVEGLGGGGKSERNGRHRDDHR